MLSKINGNKSYTGIIGWFLTEVAIQQAWIDPAAGDKLILFFKGLLGVGIAHKLDKIKKGA